MTCSSRYSIERLRASRDLPYTCEVCLGPPVAGEHAVDLLFHVGELRVAEALDRLTTQQGDYEGLVVRQEFLAAGDRSITPALLVAGEGDAAELGYEDWFAPVGVAWDVDWAVRRLCGDGRLGGRVAPSQGFGVTIVVDRAQVGDCMFPAVVGDDGPGRI